MRIWLYSVSIAMLLYHYSNAMFFWGTEVPKTPHQAHGVSYGWGSNDYNQPYQEKNSAHQKQENTSFQSRSAKEKN